MLKFRAQAIGSHTFVAVYDGRGKEQLGLCGTLNMTHAGWQHLKAIAEVASEGAPEPFNEVEIEDYSPTPGGG